MSLHRDLSRGRVTWAMFLYEHGCHWIVCVAGICRSSWTVAVSWHILIRITISAGMVAVLWLTACKSQPWSPLFNRWGFL
jgi:hypothetical protein